MNKDPVVTLCNHDNPGKKTKTIDKVTLRLLRSFYDESTSFLSLRETLSSFDVRRSHSLSLE